MSYAPPPGTVAVVWRADWGPLALSAGFVAADVAMMVLTRTQAGEEAARHVRAFKRELRHLRAHAGRGWRIFRFSKA